MKNFKIVISVLLVLTFTVCIFTACKNNGKKGSGEAGATVVVTDESGEAVTNDNGEIVTAAVDENGEIITDNGEAGADVGEKGNNAGANVGENSKKNGNANVKTSKANKKSDKKTTKSANTTKKTDNKKTVSKPAAPSKPTNLKVANVTKNSLTVTWKGVKCDAYEIQYKSEAKTWKSIGKGFSQTKFDVTGLLPYTSYSFRVRAYNQNQAGVSASAWATVSATTKTDDKYERKITVNVKLPVDGNKAEILRIYIGDMKNPVKEIKVNCDGSSKSWTSDKKYKGAVDVRVVLVKHNERRDKKTNADSVDFDISSIGIDAAADDKPF